MKPPMWGSQGPYKDCKATDDDDKNHYILTFQISEFLPDFQLNLQELSYSLSPTLYEKR
jgi:hypothetical protein